MPQPNQESDPSFTLTEIVEHGLVPEKDGLVAAYLTARLMQYAAERRAGGPELPEAVSTSALLEELDEEGRLIPGLVKEAIGRVAAREGKNETPGEQ
jgi:hypothetical protein